MATVKLAQLLDAGVHFGHKAYRWNPKMFPYLYAERDGIHILDLVQTSHLLDQACKYVNQESKKGKIFLFIGTKPEAAHIIAEEAEKCGSYYVNYRWLGGLLTNWSTVQTRIARLKHLEAQQEDGTLDRLPKKEAATVRKELEKLQNRLGGIKNMPRVPDGVIIVDQLHELTAIKEATSLNIPIISLLDTNCDPDLIDYPIPANDDSITSIKLILQSLSSNIVSPLEEIN